MSIRIRTTMLMATVAMFTVASKCENPPKSWIRLLPSNLTPVVSEIVAIDVRMDFQQSALGGGVQLVYDPAFFEFIDFTFDAGLGNEPGLTIRCPDAAEPRCSAFSPATTAILVAFGTTQAEGMQRNQGVGTLQLRALASGATQLSGQKDDFLAGGFVSAQSYNLLPVRYEAENFIIQ